jgi:hypothetical protein
MLIGDGGDGCLILQAEGEKKLLLYCFSFFVFFFFPAAVKF